MLEREWQKEVDAKDGEQESMNGRNSEFDWILVRALVFIKGFDINSYINSCRGTYTNFCVKELYKNYASLYTNLHKLFVYKLE